PVSGLIGSHSRASLQGCADDFRPGGDSMTAAGGNHGRRPHLRAAPRDVESVKPLELFFDLVFVLGFTQCTALMAAQPTWEGIGRGMLVLAMLWWAWVGYAWLTSVIE